MLEKILQASEYAKIFWIEAQKLSPELQSRYHVYGVTCHDQTLDLDKLRITLQMLINSNYNLRSTFKENNGNLEQIIHSKIKENSRLFSVSNTTEHDHILKKYITEPFDIENG